MVKLIANWILSGLALFIVSRIVDGITLTNFWSALFAVFVLGIVNTFVKPILFLLTLPVTILSLGLFTFVINALMLILASKITPGFTIHGIGSALVGSVLFSLISILLHALVK